jgi:Ca2+-binding EF-hand superfamily protein
LWASGGGFTCYELDHFYRVFQRFDRDNSDSMSCSEFANALTWLGFPYGPEKLQVGDATDWLGIDTYRYLEPRN